jgi:hypothetical protein
MVYQNQHAKGKELNNYEIFDVKYLEKLLRNKNDLLKTELVNLPNIALIRWVSYGYEFQKLFNLDNKLELEKYAYWCIKNQNVFKKYSPLLKDYFVNEYHSITYLNKDGNIYPTKLMELIWNNRPDLQELYPNIMTKNNIQYWNWWLDVGAKEYNISNKISLKNEVTEENIIKLLVNYYLSRRIDLQDIFRSPFTEDKDLLLFRWLNSREEDIFEDKVLIDFINKYHYDELNKKESKFLTSLMKLIWNNRSDLQEVFPDVLNGDIDLYWNWWIESGINEYKFFLNNAIHDEKIEESFKKEIRSPKLLKNKIKVALIGHGTGIFGLGEDARLITASLQSVGIEVDMYIANENINIGHLRNLNMKTLSEYEENYDFNIFCLPAFDMLGLIFDYGLEIFTSCINIGIWQWELSSFPKEANFSFELVHSIMSISHFSAKSIQKNTDKRVKSLFLPVIKESFIKKERSFFNLPKNDFLYYFSFDGGSFINRKNPLSIIEAFQRSFKTKSNVGLVIKVMNAPKNSDLWNECLRRINSDKRIFIIDTTLERSDFLALLDNIDVVVSLHRAEGFGRLMAEAFLYNKTSISSAYSGNLEYMTDENTYLVEGNTIPLFPNDYLFSANKEWFQPDINHAAYLMNYAYENREENNKKAAIGKNYIENIHCLLNTGNQIKEELQNILNIIKGNHE